MASINKGEGIALAVLLVASSIVIMLPATLPVEAQFNDISLDREEYYVSSIARVSLASAGEFDSEEIDVVSIEIFSDTDAGGMFIPATETDVNSNLFRGNFRFSTDPSNLAAHILQVSVGDSITASYGGNDTTATIIADFIPTVSLDSAVYLLGDTAFVTIVSATDDRIAPMTENVISMAFSGSDLQGMKNMNIETGAHTGVFATDFLLTDGSSVDNVQLHVAPQDTFTVALKELQYNGRNFRLHQFHANTGSECTTSGVPVPHWHSNDANATATDGMVVSDPAPTGCGFGKVSLVPVVIMAQATAKVIQNPDAVDDFVTTNVDTPVTINVLNNDSDPDESDTLEVSAVGEPSHGQVEIVNGEQIVYTPDPGFSGADDFDYTITDGSNTDDALITVQVATASGPDFVVFNNNDGTFTAFITATNGMEDPDTGNIIPTLLTEEGSENVVRSDTTGLGVDQDQVCYFNSSFDSSSQDSNRVCVEKILEKFDPNTKQFVEVEKTLDDTFTVCIPIDQSSNEECASVLVTQEFSLNQGGDMIVKYFSTGGAPAKQTVEVSTDILGQYRLKERYTMHATDFVTEDGRKVLILNPVQHQVILDTYARSDPMQHIEGEPLDCVGITGIAEVKSITCDLISLQGGRVPVNTTPFASASTASFTAPPSFVPNPCGPAPCKEFRVTFSGNNAPNAPGAWQLKVTFKDQSGNPIAPSQKSVRIHGFISLSKDQLKALQFNNANQPVMIEQIPASAFQNFMSMEVVQNNSFVTLTKTFGIFPSNFILDPLTRTNPDPNVDGHVSATRASTTSCPTPGTLATGTGESTISEVLGVKVPSSSSSGSSSCFRTFIEWNVLDQAIPDSAEILDVTAKFDVAGESPFNPVNARSCDFMSTVQNGLRPSTMTNFSELWGEIGDGAAYVPNSVVCMTEGTKTLDLGSAAESDLQNNLKANWFAVGVKFHDEAISSSLSSIALRSRDSTVPGATKPTLEVTYSLSPAIAYRSSSGSGLDFPKYREWDPSIRTWGPELELPSAGSPVRFVDLEFSPVSAKRIITTSGDDGLLDVYVCSFACTLRASWVMSSIATPTSIVGVSPTARTFDVAFEGTGDAILVYSLSSPDPTKDIAYRVIPERVSLVTDVQEQYIDDTGHSADTQYSWLALDSSTVKEELVLAGFDATHNDINAWVWNGNQWNNQRELTAFASAAGGGEAFAVRYSADGSKAMVIGTTGTEGNIVGQYWQGTSWVVADPGDIDGTDAFDARWITLKADPASDDLQAIVVDNGKDLHSIYWSGSSWALTSNIDTDIDTIAARPADFEWNPGGSTGRLVWDTDAIGVGLSQRTCAPQCVGTTTIMTYAGTGAWMALSGNPSDFATVKIVGARLNSNFDIGAFRFDGSIYTNLGDSVVTADTAVNTWESFKIAWQRLP